MIIDRQSRSHLVLALGMVVVAFAGVAGSEAAEVLTNPGFETGSFTPWTTDGTWGIETSNCHSGSYCASDIGNYYIRQTFTGVPGNTIGSITVWIRQPDPQGSLIILRYSDNTNDGSGPLSPTTSWTQFDMTSVLNRSKTLTAIEIWGFVNGDTIPDITVVDDVSIQTVESNVPLLGWKGLLALAALLAVAGAALARQRLA